MSIFGGHFWTIARDLQHRLTPSGAPAAEPWSVEVTDPRVGVVRLCGLIRHEPGAEGVVVVVHGLGGDVHSPYCVRMATAAAAARLASLRVALRGAEGHGEDVYHAGLVDDLDAVLSSPVLAQYRHVYMAGFSLGGHVVLRHALRAPPRVRAVAAICAPLDLAQSCTAIDRASAGLYRHVVLASLKRMYRQVAARRELPTPVSVVDRIRTIRGWDHHVVVPRHGFRSVDHYYETVSVGRELGALTVPTLYVGARHDPMVPGWTVAPALRRASDAVEVHMLDTGGHVGFPALRLTPASPPGSLEAQVLAWMTSRV